jgi:diguanylate cyclase (GGDEF)-like protein
MATRYRDLAAYSAVLAVIAVAALIFVLRDATATLSPWQAAAAIASFLAVWQLGIPAPRVGLASMERVPHVAWLLVLGAGPTALYCAIACLIWPFLSRSYSQGSLRTALLRGVHNASMDALMLIGAAAVYTLLGGAAPLRALTLESLLPLVALALTAQFINVVLLGTYFHLDGRDVRMQIRPLYSVIDLAFVPAGVLGAVLYNSAPPALFATFLVVMAIFAVSFNAIGRQLGAPTPDRTPALHGLRRIEELCQRIAAETSALLRFDRFAIALVDRDARLLDVRLRVQGKARLPALRLPLDAALLGRVARQAEALLIADWSTAPEALKELATAEVPATGSLLAVPLINDGTVIGVLALQHTETRIYADADLHLLKRLAEQVAGAIADAQAFEALEEYREHLEQRVAERTQALEQADAEKERLIAALGERSRALERESQEDPLTGIANRRHFMRRLQAEIDVARAVRRPLALAIIDLDRFKSINDRYGHLVGDEVLRRCARLMELERRDSDLVARIGGEEFALLLPGLDAGDALRVCERLRTHAETADWTIGTQRLAITLSIGAAGWSAEMDADDLFRAADDQLYRAKNLGRNRVQVSS